MKSMGYSVKVKLRMPFLHPRKSKVGARRQVQLYQAMNTSAGFKNI
jgi:hypothetical protein